MGNNQTPGLRLGGFDQIAFRADKAGEGHHHFFSNGVNGGIGDLRKQLFEVVVNNSRLIGQAGQRRIVPHGA